jgi:putative transposase
VKFIDAHKGRFGVAPICRVLCEHGCKIAPSTYYDAKGRPASKRALRDEDLKVEIARVHGENYGVYGPRKVWLQLNREGIEVARCTVERLMNVLGLQGIRRGKRWKTTVADPAATRPADLVKRRFNPPRPNALWVADFTYVATWVGVVYVAFVIDAYARRILGWRAATSMRTQLVLDALEQAVWVRRREGADLSGLVHHTDAGSQGEFQWSSQHLDLEVVRGVTRKVIEAGSDEADGGWPSAVGGGSRVAACDAVPWTAGAFSCGGARVLAVDRRRGHQRGRGRRGGRVDTGRDEVVSTRWRDAADQPGRAHRPLPVVR